MTAGTLNAALAGLRNLTDRGFTFVHEGREATHLSFAALWEQARQLQAQLQSRGLRPGQRVGLVLDDSERFIPAFMAIALSGGVPVPAASRRMRGHGADAAALTAGIFRTARVAALVSSAADLAPQEAELVPAPLWLDEELRAAPAAVVHEVACAPEDLCFVQFTSGSTSAPRGVAVTHANLLANARAIAVDALALAPGDLGVSWLPLHHDMGLVGNVLTALVHRIPMVYIATRHFIKNPRIWMKTVSAYRATVTFGPNFALALAARRASPAHVDSLDLGCLHTLGCGAEPIQPAVLRQFLAAHAPAGLAPQAIRPCYGLAEATLAVSFAAPDVQGAHRTAHFLREPLQGQGRAVAAGAVSDGDAALSIELVSCGHCIPGHTVEIVSPTGARLPLGCIGEVVVSGPSVARGYFDDPGATAQAFPDGRLRTGDLGFLHGTELFITGRVKDIVIVNGRNYLCQDIESAMAQVAGIRMGACVAFAVQRRATERLVAVAESPSSDVETLASRVRDKIASAFGLADIDVVVLRPGAIARTTSGKVRRQAMRRWYEAGLGEDTRIGAP